jgi:putative exporter of polyketide antibiotics
MVTVDASLVSSKSMSILSILLEIFIPMRLTKVKGHERKLRTDSDIFCYMEERRQVFKYFKSSKIYMVKPV